MDPIAGFAIRDAQPADAPPLTQIVRSSGAYDGTYRVMVASQLIDTTYLARNPTRVCVDDQDAIPRSFDRPSATRNPNDRGVKIKR